MEIVHVPPAPVPESATQVLVRMRDGVRLATDVHLPGGPDASQEPGPTILIRTPYDKSGAITPMPLIAEYLVERGYRVVVQDVRGRFRSEGEAVLWANEARDGSDTLDWIVAQPWSDGAVAMAATRTTATRARRDDGRRPRLPAHEVRDERHLLLSDRLGEPPDRGAGRGVLRRDRHALDVVRSRGAATRAPPPVPRRPPARRASRARACTRSAGGTTAPRGHGTITRSSPVAPGGTP